MSRQQLVQVTADGDIITLRQPKDAGVHLAEVAEADPVEVERTTEIRWSKPLQKWFVQFLKDGSVLLDPEGRWPCYFDHYEDAVAEEIREVQRRRAAHGPFIL